MSHFSLSGDVLDLIAEHSSICIYLLLKKWSQSDVDPQEFKRAVTMVIRYSYNPSVTDNLFSIILV